jgi:hypothetical protein
MIVVNVDKAKNIAHDIRRTQRSKEFQPHDEVIMKQIPGVSATEAEAARAAIREKYAQIQDQIDSSETVDQLKTIVETIKS